MLSRFIKRTLPGGGFARCARGNVSLITALAIVPISVIAGGAVDYARLGESWSQAQRTADAAALAVVISNLDIPDDKNGGHLSDDVARVRVANAMVAANIGEGLAPYVAAPVVSGPDDAGAVTVAFDLTIPASFLKLIGIPSLKASVSATAMPSNPGHACLLALGESGDGIAIGGTGSVDLESCWLYSNASGSGSIDMSGSAVVSAKGGCASGDASVGNSATVSFIPRSNCRPVADPLADQTWPAPTLPCKPKNYTDTGSATSKTRTYQAGTHCNVSTTGNIKHVVFEPGIHIVTGTSFNVGGNTVIGKGIGIYLQASVTTFDLQAQTEMPLTAMTSGAMAGIVIAQAPGGSIHADTFNGGSDLTLTGTVYLPNSALTLDGNNSTSISPVSMFIADSVIMKGTADLRFGDDFEAAGFPEIAAFATDVRLVD